MRAPRAVHDSHLQASQAGTPQASELVCLVPFLTSNFLFCPNKRKPSAPPQRGVHQGAPLASALAQDVPVQLRYSVRIHGPGQEVSEPLVSPRPRPIPGCPVFVQSHKVECASFSMPVDVGRVGVVPVFFKLLPENTLG